MAIKTKPVMLKPSEAMLLTAIKFYGLQELEGTEHNPQILNFFKEIGHSWVQDDETAWCSAFMNYCAKVNGIEMSGELNARSWLEVPERFEINPEHGDLVVFWRESKSSWKGHVGLFMGNDFNKVLCLGGNQNNQVNISPYPNYRVLGFIKLSYI